MSKAQKRPTRKERLDWAKLGAIHHKSGADMMFRGLNGEGGFAFRSPLHVWFWLTAFPALSMGVFCAASVVGFTSWPPALFVAAGFGFAGMVSMTIGMRALATRGWAQAIMDIEHRKRKEQQYKEPADA